MSAIRSDHSIDTAFTAKTLAELVHGRAGATPDDVAYTFLADGSADARSITWFQLEQRASTLAMSLSERGAVGQTVLLALPSGLAFIESLFACWYAGAIAVPVSLPRHRRVKHRLNRIVADAGARFAIGTKETHQRIDAAAADETAMRALTWLDAEAPHAAPTRSAPTAHLTGSSVGLLQYTSGSTGSPRGVIVTHQNLMRNSAIIAEACGHAPGETIAGWLPLFHDMGLVGVLQAAFSGARCVFMSPERFLMRPRLWLQMISDYKACSSPAPNFAYELCAEKLDDEQKVGLDLSCWRNALNGSEPVRAPTLHRFAAAFATCGFREEAFFPCYGLAESTLFVTGRAEVRGLARRSADGISMTGAEAGGHVGCGRAFGDTRVAIVDPNTARRVADGSIGEIWVAGESVAAGYWNNAGATAATFNARLHEPAESKSDGAIWLRTGDLGFLAAGELFITGRLRELIIVGGRNHFPVDLEQTAESADAAIAPASSAAFSVDVNGVEQVVLLTELRREFARPGRNDGVPALDCAGISRRIRAAVAAEHEVTVHEVVLLAAGGLPRTTSGKISRISAREAYLSNTMERFAGLNHEHVAT